jgi:hypothetical protein
MRRHSFPIALIVLSLLALATVALADQGSLSDPKGDVQNQPPGPKKDYDAVAATWGHTPKGKLKHKITVAGHIGSPVMGQGSSPDLLINVPGRRKPPSCDYFIQPVPPGIYGNTSDHEKWYVFKCSNAQPQKVGPAKVTRVSRHTLKFVFSQGEIGAPGRYGWKFIFPEDGDRTYDNIPNRGYQIHLLK